jgi:putative nucleotidyltransferase with HDIG domain
MSSFFGGIVITDDQILQQAFASQRWKTFADALFEATGLSLTVMDKDASSVIHAVNHCPYCDLAVRRLATDPMCFDDPPNFTARGTSEIACRGDLPCFLTPVLAGGRIMCTVLVSGFVSSTRERKRLFEKLLASGVSESQARYGVRDIPILPKKQVKALVRMAVTNATDALERATDRARLEQAVNELEVFVEAGREFTERRGIGQDLFEAILAKGMAVMNADSGSLMLRRAGTDLIEVVAPCIGMADDAQERVTRLGEGVAGRVAANGRSMLVSGDRRMLEQGVDMEREVVSTVCVPLMRAGETLGVLSLNISDPARRMTGEDVRLIERYAHMAAGVIDNARKHRATERAMFELTQLSDLAKSLSGITDTEEVVRTIGSVLSKTFDHDIAGTVIFGFGRDEATVFVASDVSHDMLEHVLGIVAGRDLDAEPLVSVSVRESGGSVMDSGLFDPDAWNVLPAELVVHGTLIGYVFVSGGPGRHFDADDRRLLVGMADHLALVIDKAELLKRMRDDLTKTIAALSVTLDATEHASPGHSDRVMDYAISLGEELGLGVEQIETLRFAGLLHDVGKAGLSEEILLKPSRLDESEVEKIRRHSEIGASVVEQIDFLNGVAPVVMHHHERWDGSGYPMGLAGEDIPFLARILAIADAFDAMTSVSPYRRRMSFAQARSELEKASGSQFDPALIAVFIDAMDRRAFAGSTGLFAPRPEKDGPQLLA